MSEIALITVIIGHLKTALQRRALHVFPK